MLRDRLLAPRWLVCLVVAWGVGVALLPQPVGAAPLPPARVLDASGDLDAVRALLEERVVRARLLALGVSPPDVLRTVERLTPAERAELAARAEELGTGASAVEIIAISIIFTMLVILVLELMGRRVISRP